MELQLRPFDRDDVAMLQRFATDPVAAGTYNWVGFRNRNAIVQRFDDDGLLSDELGCLVVVAEGADVGAVQWRPAGYDAIPVGSCWRIGCTILPEHRGRGIGAAAHRALVSYLFSFTAAVRVEADTDIDNTAERRCLEHVGFTEEGVLRSVTFRGGGWRDVVRYGLLRHEHHEMAAGPSG